MYQWLQRLFSGAASSSEPQGAPAPVETEPPVVAPAPPTVPFDQFDQVNSLYHQSLFGTGNDCDFDCNPLEQQALDALSAIIESQKSGAALVRRMPGMIPQLLQSLRSDNFSGAQLSRTISNDVVLVAAVTHLANSALKGTGTTISSVEHAVMVIGQEGLRHLITSLAFRPIIDMQSGYFTRTLAPRIWEHSERCAVANRVVAAELGVAPFEAFLAGLVHNVGLIVALRIMDQVAKGDRNFGSEMFCARLMRDARVLTCSIGREWHFPDNVTLAISEQGGVRKGAVVSPLGSLLGLSDYLCKLRVLVEEGRVARNDPALFAGLPSCADELYHALVPIDTPA
jgi:HD-like signal output (HDOD) protein